MAWRTFDEVQNWVDEHGGLDGGGFEELQKVIREGRFGEGRMSMARAYEVKVLSARYRPVLDRLVAENAELHATAPRADEPEELKLARRQAEAAESQARTAIQALDAAQSANITAAKAVHNSGVANGLSLLALVVALVALLTSLAK